MPYAWFDVRKTCQKKMLPFDHIFRLTMPYSEIKNCPILEEVQMPARNKTRLNDSQYSIQNVS